jgi:hypothetical protein
MPLRVTVLVAVIAGVAGVIGAMLLQVVYSATLISLVLGTSSVLPLVGASSVLLVPMDNDRRNMVGFLTFISALLVLLADSVAFGALFLPS